MTDNTYADPQERIARFQSEVDRLERIVEARNKECNRLAITAKELRSVIVAKNEALAMFADKTNWLHPMPDEWHWGFKLDAAPETIARAALEQD